ncbi:hypothetical protein OROMI_013152 [Orobanche minor]
MIYKYAKVPNTKEHRVVNYLQTIYLKTLGNKYFL